MASFLSASCMSLALYSFAPMSTGVFCNDGRLIHHKDDQQPKHHQPEIRQSENSSRESTSDPSLGLGTCGWGNRGRNKIPTFWARRTKG